MRCKELKMNYFLKITAGIALSMYVNFKTCVSLST